MRNSTETGFALLGCATSDLANDAYPFVIVVIAPEVAGAGLKSYVLRGWQNIRAHFPDAVREDLLYFLDSLADYSPGMEASRFFVRLQDLSVGPIRCLTGGVCTPNCLDESIIAMLDGRLEPVLWPDSFDAV